MRIFGLVLIYLAFLGIIGPALLVYNLQTTVLSSSTPIENALAKADTYNRILAFGADDLTQMLSSDERDPQSQISTEQIQQILASIPPDTLRRVCEQALDAYFSSLRNGTSYVDIDIREIKQKTFGDLPPELKTEVNKSVPDTYQVKLNNKNANLWKFLFTKNSKYYMLGIIVFLGLLTLLLGRGWRGKIRSLAGLVLITGILALISYYALKLLPISRLISLTDNVSSQKLLSLLNDILQQLLAPIVEIYHGEWMYTLIITFVLFLITWIIPGSKQQATQTDVSSVAPVAITATPPTTTPAPVNPVENIAGTNKFNK